MNHTNFYHNWEKNSKKILTVNCGSSSVKLSVFKIENDCNFRLLDVHFKSIHSHQSKVEIESLNEKKTISLDQELNIFDVLKFFSEFLHDNFSFDYKSLVKIGHRFVHGGPVYRETCQITESIIHDLKALCDLAPLHNDSCLQGIEACLKIFENVSQFVVFDTAFYKSLPFLASHYAIPLEFYEKKGIKRYGFHGISHSFLWNVYNKTLKNSSENNIVTLHLGNGCSITAISNGNPIDTSMGFTPSEGLMMATRAGDIDSGIIEYLNRVDGQSVEDIMKIYNYHSGLLGISEISSKMEILVQEYSKNPNAKFAIEMFCYRIIKYIGAYTAILKGINALIFSGGIGENSSFIREKIIDELTWLGVKIDPSLNQNAISIQPGTSKKISTTDSRIPIYVIGTDENLAIANEIKTHVIKEIL